MIYSKLITHERINVLKKRADAEPEIWQPEVGEYLIGGYVGRTAGAMAVLIEELSTSKTWRVLLDNRMRHDIHRLDPHPKDLICIKALGKKLDPAGRAYNAYSLVIDRDI